MSIRLGDFSNRSLGALLALALVLAPTASTVATTVFSTRFEASEGYNDQLDLAGQNGWLQFGSGGNGLRSGFFPGEGQQAYIGYAAPNAGDNRLFLWKPINYSPLAANTPVVVFSVLLGFVDSTTNRYDDFYWTFFNIAGDPLFTINFRNETFEIGYALGTNTFVWTGKTFTNDVIYELVVTMNFASNLWTATLDGSPLATNKPMTTTGAPLDLGDVDAAWVLADPARAGDNFMLFDNYSLVAPPPPPRLQLIERTPAGNVYLKLEGQKGARFAIDATTDLSNWTPLTTNTVNNGSFFYLDTSAAALSHRCYRARWVP
jgi:hypothetical protein